MVICKDHGYFYFHLCLSLFDMSSKNFSLVIFLVQLNIITLCILKVQQQQSRSFAVDTFSEVVPQHLYFFWFSTAYSFQTCVMMLRWCDAESSLLPTKAAVSKLPPIGKKKLHQRLQSHSIKQERIITQFSWHSVNRPSHVCVIMLQCQCLL